MISFLGNSVIAHAQGSESISKEENRELPSAIPQDIFKKIIKNQVNLRLSSAQKKRIQKIAVRSQSSIASNLDLLTPQSTLQDSTIIAAHIRTIIAKMLIDVRSNLVGRQQEVFDKRILAIANE